MTENQLQEKAVNRFNVLNAIDVSDHIEKKNNLSYLSWAWAWQELKKVYPDSYYTIYKNPEGWLYFTDGKTCWVETGVTLVDGDYKLEHVEHLPIMDFKNQSLPKDKVTSMDVNKAIQRSLTKAAARHGVGLYIYAGEDLPEEPDEVKAARETQIADLKAQIKQELTRVGAGMSNAEKIALTKQYITPAIGNPNYNACADVSKLTTLLASLKKIPNQAA